MNVEAKKLNLIERFMKLKDESSIEEMELAMTRVEINYRADESMDDIKKGKVRSYDEFNLEVSQWLNNKKNTK